jgi:hypothetical protein
MSAPGPAPDKIWGFRIKTMKKHGKFTTNEMGNSHHYTMARSANNWKRAQVYFLSNIKKNEKILEEGPGIYTWILKADNFYATKVTTPQEIGTLHFILDNLTPIKFTTKKSKRMLNEPIILAGELKINDDGTIVFNLESGSYTLLLINGLKERDLKELTDPAQEKIIEKIQELSKNPEYTDLSTPLEDGMLSTIASSIEQMMRSKFRTDVTYYEHPLIDGANIRTSMNDIARFNSFLTKNQNEQQGGKRRTRKIHKARKTHKSRK